MPYTLPNFNLTALLFTNGTPIGGGNPFRVEVACCKVPGKRSFSPYGAVGTFQDPLFSTYLLMDYFSDVRGPLSPSGADGVECPGDSVHFYTVAFVESVAEGHPNQHLLVALVQLPPYPEPFNGIP